MELAWRLKPKNIVPEWFLERLFDFDKIGIGFELVSVFGVFAKRYPFIVSPTSSVTPFLQFHHMKSLSISIHHNMAVYFQNSI